MLVYRSRFLTRGEIWFDEEPDHCPVDWILYRMRSRPVPGARWKYFHTLLINLAASEDELLARLKKDTAYKIKRARRTDGVICEMANPCDPRVLDRFEEVYNRFAVVKGLLPLQRTILVKLAEVGRLDISLAKDASGTPLVYHANYRTPERASGMLSVSMYRECNDSSLRNAISRANRYLTWEDLMRYKSEGLKAFDFGGWYTGTTNQTLLKINEFKRGFGGQIVREYQCEQTLTIRGHLVLLLAEALNKARAWPDRAKQFIGTRFHAPFNSRKVSPSV